MSCNKDKMPWEPWEDEAIARLYPTGGTRAVGEVLSHRKAFAIQKRASLNNVSYGAPVGVLSPSLGLVLGVAA